VLTRSDYPWYALSVKARHEKAVAAALRGRGVLEFLPLYRSFHESGGRIQSVNLPLFPGYIFCSFDYRNRMLVLVNPGVLSIVGNGNSATPVDTREIDSIASMIQSGLAVSPWPFVKEGDIVYVEKGPLRGLQGTLIAFKGDYRVVVSVGLLQRSVAVEVNRWWVRPLPEAAPGRRCTSFA
jgi:transcription antitermination factor NusG